jgi:hypothetical protein
MPFFAAIDAILPTMTPAVVIQRPRFDAQSASAAIRLPRVYDMPTLDENPGGAARSAFMPVCAASPPSIRYYVENGVACSMPMLAAPPRRYPRCSICRCRYATFDAATVHIRQRHGTEAACFTREHQRCARRTSLCAQVSARKRSKSVKSTSAGSGKYRKRSSCASTPHHPFRLLFNVPRA